MAVDVVAGAAPAVTAGEGAGPTASDQAQFEQAFLQLLPSAASFMLMSIGQDAVQELMQAGDENANAPEPGG
ncbi:MAG: hypothetical protein WA418_25590 [Bradyrhizobium sp.]